MTPIKFSDSMGVAVDFASKLISGHLNVHPGKNSDRRCTEIRYHDDRFSTAIIDNWASELRGYRLTEIEASDIEDNTSTTPSSQIRHITIYATDPCDVHPMMATFDLELNIHSLKGVVVEHSGWYVTNVQVQVGRSFRLNPQILGGNKIWGELKK